MYNEPLSFQNFDEGKDLKQVLEKVDSSFLNQTEPN